MLRVRRRHHRDDVLIRRIPPRVLLLLGGGAWLAAVLSYLSSPIRMPASLVLVVLLPLLASRLPKGSSRAAFLAAGILLVCVLFFDLAGFPGVREKAAVGFLLLLAAGAVIAWKEAGR